MYCFKILIKKKCVYLYILRGFGKLVIVFLTVKNISNLINLFLFIKKRNKVKKKKATIHDSLKKKFFFKKTLPTVPIKKI